MFPAYVSSSARFSNLYQGRAELQTLVATYRALQLAPLLAVQPLFRSNFFDLDFPDTQLCVHLLKAASPFASV